MMERRMRGNSHVRCEVGENLEITSKDYLSLYDAVAGVLESLEESEMDEFLGEVISPALESLYVTTKEIDEMVRRLAGVLAAGMNQAFSGEL